jgi:CubicO group peptidase (beta-lactamase class C family)
MIHEDAVDALIERAGREIDQGILPSCQLAIAYEGEIVREVTLGDAPLGDETRYTMYSATKAVVASAVWQLLAEGAISLDDRVADHISEFGTNGKDVVTVEQVLLHTSGFPRAPLGPPQWDTREGRLAAFSKWRLNWEPSTRYEYHATTAHWVLAELLARTDGCEHTESLRRRVLDPLGMKKLAIGVPEAEQGDIAKVVHTGEPATPEELQAVLGVSSIDVGEVTDEALESFNEPEVITVGVPGGGGVSTASELALFYQALLRNPFGLWDPKWLSIATTDVRNNFPDPLLGVPANRTIGLILYGADGKGPMRGFGHGQSAGTFGHNGAGGQLAWADPVTGISFAYMTNGLDRHTIRQARRSVGISSRAAATASAT